MSEWNPAEEKET